MEDIHSRYLRGIAFYDGHKLDTSDLDLPAYIDEKVAEYNQLHPPSGGGVESVVDGSGISVDATDPAHPIISLSSYQVYSVEKIITHADILTLPSIPVVITPEYSGANKLYRFVNGIAIFDFTGGAYTNIDPFQDGSGFYLGYNYDPLQAASNYTPTSLFGNDVVKNICFLNPEMSDFDGYPADPTKQLDYLINKQLIFAMDNNLGNLTGGHADNTIKLKINYLVIDVEEWE